MFDYIERLTAFGELTEGWDSYGAHPIDRDALAATHAFLMALFTGSAALVPTSAGGVQIETHSDGLVVELEFEPNGDITGFHDRAAA